jgi:hypothetical protein
MPAKGRTAALVLFVGPEEIKKTTVFLTVLGQDHRSREVN